MWRMYVPQNRANRWWSNVYNSNVRACVPRIWYLYIERERGDIEWASERASEREREREWERKIGRERERVCVCVYGWMDGWRDGHGWMDEQRDIINQSDVIMMEINENIKVPHCERNSSVTCEFPAPRVSNAENVSIWYDVTMWRQNEMRGPRREKRERNSS